LEQTSVSTTDLSVLADAPGEFAVEMRTRAATDPRVRGEAETQVHEAIGINHQGGDDVLLTIEAGDENINLQLCPRDIKILRKALDLCDQRLSTDSAAQRADDQRETDCT
tara:strand:+ start:4944 stop:5273 length:330 start_codon:yes stop_codon:yes gene_type:complete